MGRFRKCPNDLIVKYFRSTAVEIIKNDSKAAIKKKFCQNFCQLRLLERRYRDEQLKNERLQARLDRIKEEYKILHKSKNK